MTKTELMAGHFLKCDVCDLKLGFTESINYNDLTVCTTCNNILGKKARGIKRSYTSIDDELQYKQDLTPREKPKKRKSNKK